MKNITFYLLVICAGLSMSACTTMNLSSTCSNSLPALISFCGACKKDSDCGTWKCCKAGCPSGKKKCVNAKVCP